MRNDIVDVRFNNEEPTKYGYKHFEVIFENGKIQTFHYNKNNPIPTKAEIIGWNWEELIKLCERKIYGAIKC